MSGRECWRIRVTLRAEGLTPRPREETAALSAHLAGCAGCRAYAAQERAARAALTATYGRVDPLPLARGWRAALPGRRARGRGWGAFGAALNGALAVALVAIVALVGGLALRGMNGGTGSAPPATVAFLPAAVCSMAASGAAPSPTSGRGNVQLTAVAAATRAAQPPAVREDRCTMPTSGLLTLEAAAIRLRAFLGQPEAQFAASYIPVYSGFSDTTPAYYTVGLRELLPDGTTRQDLFNIDARTGLVSGANFFGWATAPALAQPLDSEAARARAEDYARAHFPDFGTLIFAGIRTQRGVPQNGIDEEFLVARWDVHDPVSGAVLPTNVQVTVSPRSGQIVGYSARQDTYGGPTVPQIMREEAEGRAREAQLARGFLDVPASGSALYGLPAYSLNANQAGPVLVWAVQFPGYVPVYVDALTGAIIVEGPKG